jgi:hypothetical protein
LHFAEKTNRLAAARATSRFVMCFALFFRLQPSTVCRWANDGDGVRKKVGLTWHKGGVAFGIKDGVYCHICAIMHVD